MDKYGSQEVLAAPIDKGFNRLAWLLPYAVGRASASPIVGGTRGALDAPLRTGAGAATPQRARARH